MVAIHPIKCNFFRPVFKLFCFLHRYDSKRTNRVLVDVTEKEHQFIRDYKRELY